MKNTDVERIKVIYVGSSDSEVFIGVCYLHGFHKCVRQTSFGRNKKRRGPRYPINFDLSFNKKVSGEWDDLDHLKGVQELGTEN